jgi:hypothetical protein
MGRWRSSGQYLDVGEYSHNAGALLMHNAISVLFKHCSLLPIVSLDLLRSFAHSGL